MRSRQQLNNHCIDARKRFFGLEGIAIEQNLGRFSSRDDLHFWAGKPRSVWRLDDHTVGCWQ